MRTTNYMISSGTLRNNGFIVQILLFHWPHSFQVSNLRWEFKLNKMLAVHNQLDNIVIRALHNIFTLVGTFCLVPEYIWGSFYFFAI